MSILTDNIQLQYKGVRRNEDHRKPPELIKQRQIRTRDGERYALYSEIYDAIGQNVYKNRKQLCIEGGKVETHHRANENKDTIHAIHI